MSASGFDKRRLIPFYRTLFLDLFFDKRARPIFVYVALIIAIGTALVAMADDFEVEPTQAYLANMGAEVESYHVPEETMDELEAQAEAAEEAVGDSEDK